MTEQESRTYKITATKEQLDILETLFNTMQMMGNRGSSREIKLYVDGDGAFRPKFKRYEHDVEKQLKPLVTDMDVGTIVCGDGCIKRNCNEWKGKGYYIYYDFG